MTDRYERIREALAKGPTPGPWQLSIETPTIIKQDLSSIGLSRGGVLIGSACGHESSGRCPTREQAIANARLIAACDPDTIRELLAERDALAAALEAAREDAERYRWLRMMAKEQLMDPKAAGAEYCPDMRTYWRLPTLICSGPAGGHIDFDAAIDQAMKEQA